MTSGLWKSISFSTGLPGMAKTHIKGPPEHLDVTSGQAMSAACRRRVRCHSAVPLLVAPRRWEMLRLRIDGAREIWISRLQQFLAGIDAWLLQSPLWLMCVGLSFLGELCHWLLWLYVCRYYPVTINPPEDLFDLSCVKWWFPLGFSYSKEQVHGDKHANGACVTLWSKKRGWLVRREFVELEVLGVWAIVSERPL